MQKIYCKVYDCKYNSPLNDKCMKKKIIVRCLMGKSNFTMCGNYKKL